MTASLLYSFEQFGKLKRTQNGVLSGELKRECVHK
jgi:hypothetical protein